MTNEFSTFVELYQLLLDNLINLFQLCHRNSIVWSILNLQDFQFWEKIERIKRNREKINDFVWNQRSKAEVTRIMFFPLFGVTSPQSYNHCTGCILWVEIPVIGKEKLYAFFDEDIQWRCEPRVQWKGFDLMKINHN